MLRLLRRKKRAEPVTGGSWWNLGGNVRLPYPGSWQRNREISAHDRHVHFAVFACMTLIAGDIAKLRLRVMRRDGDIWVEHESSPFANVLRRPNGHQNRIQFVEHWLLSKLRTGNTYALKGRDRRGVVDRLWVLDPTRVEPLVAPDGQVFYRLHSDKFAGIEEDQVVVPASEIIHDRYNTLFHPLIGLSPIMAAALSIEQGISIQRDSAEFFGKRAVPAGILLAPGALDQGKADAIQEHWQAGFGKGGDNRHGVAVLADGMKFEPIRATAHDSQVIEQLRWTAEVVCSVYHVPPHKIGIGQAPSYNNVQALNVDYFAQAVQKLVEDMELSLDVGLELPRGQTTQFCLDGLLRMDSKAQAEVLDKQMSAGMLSPNEGRATLNRAPVAGGESPYMQQQMWSLAQLASRSGPDDAGDADVRDVIGRIRAGLGVAND